MSAEEKYAEATTLGKLMSLRSLQDILWHVVIAKNIEWDNKEMADCRVSRPKDHDPKIAKLKEAIATLDLEIRTLVEDVWQELPEEQFNEI